MHGRCADHSGADQHWLGGGLEGVASAVVLFQQFLGDFKVRLKAKVALHFSLNAGQLLDGGQFEN